MRNIALFLMAWLSIGLAQAFPALPRQATINFTLNHIEQGESCPAILQNERLTMYYEYDFNSGRGLAYLKKLQETRWTEVLHPLGLSDVYGFMSDMAPKVIHLKGGDVVVYRIIFNLRFNGDADAMLMLGEDGDCIMGTDVINVNK